MLLLVRHNSVFPLVLRKLIIHSFIHSLSVYYVPQTVLGFGDRDGQIDVFSYFLKRLTNQYDNNIIIINKVLPSGQIKILL
jgi:hypothetical protein